MKVSVKVLTAKILFAKELVGGKKEPEFGICRVKCFIEGKRNKTKLLDSLNKLEIAKKMQVNFAEVLCAFTETVKKEASEITGDLIDFEVIFEENPADGNEVKE